MEIIKFSTKNLEDFEVKNLENFITLILIYKDRTEKIQKDFRDCETGDLKYWRYESIENLGWITFFSEREAFKERKCTI